MLKLKKILREKLKIRKFRFANLYYLIFITFIAATLSLFAYLQTRPTVEPPGSEVSTLPKEIQKNYQPPQASTSATLRVPILMYHYVEYVKDKKDTIRQSLNINPNIFDNQVKTLKNAGYAFITASDLADTLDGKIKLPDKPVMLTFDDGHWDLYTDVLPILEKYHVKATAYVVSGFIGGSDSLSQDQLEKVIQSGLVEIGDHTVHHISLAKKLLPIVKYEVDRSKQTLEKKYHIKVVSFAYPYGSFDNQAISVLKAAGFRTAVSTIPGILQNQSNHYFLFRLRPGRRMGPVLLKYLEQSNYGRNYPDHRPYFVVFPQ